MKAEQHLKDLAEFAQDKRFHKISVKFNQLRDSGAFSHMPRDTVAFGQKLGLGPIVRHSGDMGAYYYPLRPVNILSQFEYRAARRLHDMQRRGMDYYSPFAFTALGAHMSLQAFQDKSAGVGLIGVALLGLAYYTGKNLKISEPVHNMVGVYINGDKRCMSVVEYYDPARNRRGQIVSAPSPIVMQY